MRRQELIKSGAPERALQIPDWLAERLNEQAGRRRSPNAGLANVDEESAGPETPS